MKRKYSRAPCTEVKNMAGLGGRPRNLWLAKIVTFRNPQAARQAASKMTRLYRSAKGMPGRVLIVRSADLAYRRARANAMRGRNPQRRAEMKQVAAAYGKIVRNYKSRVDMGAPRSDPRISKSYFRMRI
jgi:hypothetical protein